MSWRTVVVDSKAKLSYKNGYLVVRNEEIKMIHLSEINTIIINSTAITLTSYLVVELLSRKIKIIFCDTVRNPIGEVIPYYGCHNSSKRLSQQIGWTKEAKEMVWTKIIEEKILNQARTLKKYNIEKAEVLYKYASELQHFDKTNREGHAAKVYFDALFGLDFSRDNNDGINSALNYGYTILLSQFNREVVNLGYSTQLGMKHHNEFNYFNLSCDLMEPFRPLVDRIVKDNPVEDTLDIEMKLKLIDVLNTQVRIKGRLQYLTNAINIYVNSVIKAVSKCDPQLICFFENEI